jgi:hypothetical protein
LAQNEGWIKMKRFSPVSYFVTLLLLSLLTTPQLAQADWYMERIDGGEVRTKQRMVDEGLLQVRADNYYTVDVAQVESTPQSSGTIQAPLEIAKYAVVLDGVIDKIINWDGYSENEDLNENAVLIKLPEGDGVTYFDEKGIVRLSPIYQGSIVSVQVSPTEKVTPEIGLVQKAPLNESNPPIGAVVPNENASVVKEQVVASDNSISMKIEVPTANLPTNSTVSIQVVTDGRSTTSIGIDPSGASTTVTVNNLPQNENVTVKTVITDTLLNKETVIVNPLITTISAPIKTPEPARSSAEDKVNVAIPAVSSSTIDATGHRVIEIKTPEIPNFDPTKSSATLMVVGPGGSTTAIGLFGSGETLSVGSLGPDSTYTVKVVIRDLGTGQETVIAGQPISKGINP